MRALGSLAVLALVAALAVPAGCQRKKQGEEPAKTESQDKAQGKANPPAQPDVHAGVDRSKRPASRFDKNGDGIIDEEERAEIITQRAARIMTRLDADKDGKLTVAEIESAPGPMGRMLGEFSTVDTDSDGSLTADELRAAITERRLLRRKPVRPTGKGDSSKR